MCFLLTEGDDNNNGVGVKVIDLLLNADEFSFRLVNNKRTERGNCVALSSEQFNLRDISKKIFMIHFFVKVL